MSVGTINFYRLAEPYGCFSNFHRSSIEIDGRSYATVEHYFQAMKFLDPAHRELVATRKTPSGAAKLGRQPHYSYRADWEQVKERVMKRALRAKFVQHADLGTILLSTGDAEIVEHTENDSYWGDGGDGSGRNRLGILLEVVRRELRAEPMSLDGPASGCWGWQSAYVDAIARPHVISGEVYDRLESFDFHNSSSLFKIYKSRQVAIDDYYAALERGGAL